MKTAFLCACLFFIVTGCQNLCWSKIEAWAMSAGILFRLWHKYALTRSQAACLRKPERTLPKDSGGLPIIK